jgi:hypothetical protein
MIEGLGQCAGMSPEDVTPSKWIRARESNKAQFSFWAPDERVEGVRPTWCGGCFRPGDDFVDVRSSHLELLRREALGLSDGLRRRLPKVDPVSGFVDLPSGIARIDRSHIHAPSLTGN